MLNQNFSEKEYSKYNSIIKTIEDMHNDYKSSLSISDYAKKCNLSKYHYIHLFKQYTNMSPYAYIMNIRMEKAKELLKYTTLSISEIAEFVGYNNPLNFSNIFKKYTGQSPLNYRKSHN